MRKSSVRTRNYLFDGSSNPERVRRFREQMADFARGQRIRDLRESQHQSQETLAAELGVSTKSVRTWEKGGKIRWVNAKRLGEYFGEDPETLVSREVAALSAEAPETQLDRIEERLEQLEEKLRSIYDLNVVGFDAIKTLLEDPPSDEERRRRQR